MDRFAIACLLLFSGYIVRCSESAEDGDCPILETSEARCSCSGLSIYCGAIDDHLFPKLFTVIDQSTPSPIFTKIVVTNSSANRLSSGVFDTIKTRELFLEGISLESIGTNAFSPRFKEHVEALYLSRNVIDRISPGTFDNFTRLFQLKLNSNSLTTVTKSEFTLLPRLRNLYLHDNKIVTIEDNAFPSSLTFLTLHKNELAQLSENAFSGLMMTGLNLRENQLTSLPDNIFRTNTKLTSIDLSWNKLTSVNDKVFRDLDQLIRLDIALNELESVHEDAFSGLENLKVLDLSNNKLSVISEKHFTPLRKLNELYINQNDISDMDGVFVPLQRLTFLNIMNNNINTLTNNTLSGLRNLKRLKLGANRMRSIAVDAFWGSPKLEILEAAPNGLSELPRELFRYSDALDFVNFGRNQFTAFPDVFVESQKVTNLDLGSNRIQYIDRSNFVNITNLVNLNLGNNAIEYIEEGSFRTNTNLTVLTLAKNPLVFILPNTFEGLNSLETLEFNNTCTYYLNPQSFAGLGNLQRLSFTKSHMETIPSGVFSPLKNLKVLDFSQNNISVIESGAFDSLQLDVLNISFNSFDATQLKTVTETKNAVIGSLDISFNNITSFSGISTGFFEALGSLYMSGNPLDCDCSSNTFWLRTLKTLQDVDTISCEQPSRFNNMKAVCFRGRCEDVDNVFQTSCRDPDANTTIIEARQAEASSWFPSRCFRLIYTTLPPTTTTMFLNTTTPPFITTPDFILSSTTDTPNTTIIYNDTTSTYFNETFNETTTSTYTFNETTTSIYNTTIMTTTTQEMNATDNRTIPVVVDLTMNNGRLNVAWQISQADRPNMIGVLIQTFTNGTAYSDDVYLYDPERSHYDVGAMSLGLRYVVCVEVIPALNSTLIGGSDCADIFAPPMIAETGTRSSRELLLPMVIAMTVALTVITAVILLACLCSRRKSKKSPAASVGNGFASNGATGNHHTPLEYVKKEPDEITPEPQVGTAQRVPDPVMIPPISTAQPKKLKRSESVREEPTITYPMDNVLMTSGQTPSQRPANWVSSFNDIPNSEEEMAEQLSLSLDMFEHADENAPTNEDSVDPL